MTSDCISTMALLSPPPGNEAERLRRRVILMGELETSLEASRNALLALDLANIENETRHQIYLIREFDLQLQASRTPAARERSAEPGCGGAQVAVPELEETLGRSQKRIFDALRLQAALLARARRKLRVLANMLAGPSGPYGPLLTRDGGLGHLNWKQRGS